MLAFVATLVLTALLAADLLRMMMAAAQDAVPMLTVLRSLIYVFASAAVMLFFWSFYRRQS
jgi:hypothetical protein